MFACPHCAQALQQQRGPQGVIWLCPACKGHAASLGVLRKVFGAERLATIWNESCRDDVQRGGACPVCQGATARVTWLEQGNPLVVDLCRRCEFVWFDPQTYEAIAPASPAPHRLGDVDIRSLPIDVREQLAMARVKEIADEAAHSEDSPDLTWKTAPAFFGLPVEIEEVGTPRVPVATYALAAVIAIASLWAFLLERRTGFPVEDALGLIPAEAGRDHGLTFVSSFFLHAGWWHLVGNLYFLVIFGRHVEGYLRSWRWLLIVAVSALVGDFLDIACRSASTVPLIGASGGISGVLAFYALQFPHARLGLLLFIRFYPRWINIPAWGAFALWILMQLWGAFLELKHMGNVASLAHLGGVGAGFAFWLLWRNLDSKPEPGAISSFPVVSVR